jgi:hypothetical protein
MFHLDKLYARKQTYDVPLFEQMYPESVLLSAVYWAVLSLQGRIPDEQREYGPTGRENSYRAAHLLKL